MINFADIPQQHYKLDEIEVGERFRVNYGDIQELKSSMKDVGLLNPLTVTTLEVTPPFKVKLVAGGRRHRALSQMIKEKAIADNIPCRVFNDKDLHGLRLAELYENIHRKSLTFEEDIELKAQVHKLSVLRHGKKTSTAKGAEGHTIAQTAALFNVSPSSISKDLQLYNDCSRLKEAGVDLSQFKTKDDVRKLMKSLTKQGTNIVGAHVAKQKLGSASERVKRMADAYRVEDFLKCGSTLNTGTFHFVEIDPPYAIALQDIKKNFGDNYVDYNEVHMDGYVQFMYQTLTTAYHLMAPDSWGILWHATEWHTVLKYILEGGSLQGAMNLYRTLMKRDTIADLTMPVYETTRFTVEQTGGVWVKTRGQTMRPETKLASAYEPFFVFRKGAPILHKMGHINVFTDDPVNPEAKMHPTERPASMLSEMLSIFAKAGDNILVPFAGSGRTLIEAYKKDMFATGFDLSQSYKDSYLITITKEIQ